MALVVTGATDINTDPGYIRATALGPILKMYRASLKMAPPSLYKNVRHLAPDYHSHILC